MSVGGLKAERASGGPSWNEVEKLSHECEELITDRFEGTSKKSESASRIPSAPESETRISSVEAPHSVADRTAPSGVMGAVISSMVTAKSAWETYEDAYQNTEAVPYEGHGFDRYFSHGVEDRSNLRMRKFEERNFENLYYDYHYLEHHLRENDDERLADRARADERMAEARASERSSVGHESSVDDERRAELELERRNDYRMNYEEE
jgi:hypothetical protein